MGNVSHCQCVTCGKRYSLDEVRYTCPDCGNDAGLLDIHYDWDAVRRTFTPESLALDPDPSISRYADLLPVRRELLPPLQVGGTPLYHANTLGRYLGLTRLFVKDDGRNPTASFKDRASAVVVARMREIGEKVVTCASTGNAASSLAGMAAACQLVSFIFVPERAPKAKVAQLLVFGAQVLMVAGTYDQAFDLCLEATNKFGWYNRNTGYNPVTLEGKKTAALEIVEQLGWEVPDRVLVSVGDGCILAGIGKGFQDLLELGYIDRLPQLIGVQAEGSAVLKRAYDTHSPIVPVPPDTLADSIAVGHPRVAAQAIRALERSNGIMLAVSDEAILEAMRVLARYGGVFGEPAGVTGLAGLMQLLAEDRLERGERIAVVVTGNGLKDVDGALLAVGEPLRIQPTKEALYQAVHDITTALQASSKVGGKGFPPASFGEAGGGRPPSSGQHAIGDRPSLAHQPRVRRS